MMINAVDEILKLKILVEYLFIFFKYLCFKKPPHPNLTINPRQTFFFIEDLINLLKYKIIFEKKKINLYSFNFSHNYHFNLPSPFN